MTAPDPTDLSLRDPKRIQRLFPRLEFLFDYYFRVDIEGLQHVPEDGPAILCSNHCGSTYTMEGAMLATALFRRYGLAHELYFMAHRAFFDVPLARDWLLSIGAVLGTRDVAAKILRRGSQFIVFPGGDRDSHKPYRDRNKVNFFGHAGFIRISLQERVPIVPFVHVGVHEMLFVLSSGERFARISGLKKLTGLSVFPTVLSFPFGLSFGAIYPAIPLPSKISMKVMEPIRLWDMGWNDPDNPKHIAQSLEYITKAMQRELSTLAAARRWPLIG